MPQTGYTPLLVYGSTTPGSTPSAANLTTSALGVELAVNAADGKLFYKDNGGSVQVIAWKTTPTTAGGTGLTSWTAGDLPYYATGTTLSKLGIGTNGQVLTSTGTAPQWSTLSGVAVTTFSAGTTGFTPSSATSGAVTLAGTLATTNGGTGLTSFTANGVVYASSTSALTTGSALNYNGTNLGVGSSSYGAAGTIAVAVGIPGTTTGGIQLWSGTASSHSIAWGDGTTGTDQYRGYIEYAHSDDTMRFAVAATEAMRLTSTGLGIGTSSPSYRLDVSSASTPVARFTGAANAYVDFTDGTVTSRLQNSGALLFGTTSNHSLLLRTNSTTQATLDTSGNLGLGVTPSAWTRPAIQVGAAGTVAYFAATNVAAMTANMFYDGQNKYIGTGAATQYAQSAGAHVWYTAASGTAGNAISFTQAMTLTAGGALGIGVTSPARPLEVNGTIRIPDGSSLEWGGTTLAIAGGSNTLQFFTNSTERARITSGGLFGLGVTSPQAMFDLAGDYKEGVVTANTGTAYTINTANGTLQILTLTGNCTFTFPTAVAGESFTLLLRQDGTGGRTVTWPAAVRWPGNTAPTITSTASQTDKYIFTADGTRWYGSVAGQAYVA